MKKGLLLIVVLAAWFLMKNLQHVQPVTNNNNSIEQQATKLAKHVQQKVLSFTTVHLPDLKIKTNNCKYIKITRPLQACRKAQGINHETLLTINSL